MSFDLRVRQQPQQPLIEVLPAENGSAYDFGLTQQIRERREQEREALRALLDAIYAPDYGEVEKERWALLWDEQRDLWLERFPSPHTKSAYARSLREFRAFLYERFSIKWMWMTEPRHAAMWIQFMQETGSALRPGRPLMERSINLRLAAVSSYFNHMTEAAQLVNGNQVGLFVSADGHMRLNPFRVGTVERPAVTPFGSSKPVPTQAMQWILRSLMEKREKTVANHRDLALLLLFYRTGYRASSALDMQWGDFEAAASGDGMVHLWSGKGGKEKRKKIPNRVWNAIVAYLKADGRYMTDGVGMDPEMYIWQPTTTKGNHNLAMQRAMAKGLDRASAELVADREVHDASRNKPIAISTANEMLRRHLKRYFTYELRRQGHGVQVARTEGALMAKQFHLHCIRHTYAHELDRASNGDLRLVSESLDHGQLETTRIYLDRIRDPESKAANLLAAMFEI